VFVGPTETGLAPNTLAVVKGKSSATPRFRSPRPWPLFPIRVPVGAIAESPGLTSERMGLCYLFEFTPLWLLSAIS
jgi:hypothetical protein